MANFIGLLLSFAIALLFQLLVLAGAVKIVFKVRRFGKAFGKAFMLWLWILLINIILFIVLGILLNLINLASLGMA